MTEPYLSTAWPSGARLTMARLARIYPAALAAILHRRVQCGGRLAMRLHAASLQMGREIPVETWLQNLTIDHPAFFGAPKPVSQSPEAL
jgi:hypothetical protein